MNKNNSVTQPQIPPLTTTDIPHPENGLQSPKKVPYELNSEQRRYIASLPPRFRGQMAKAYARVVSPRDAIRAKCFECMGYEDVGSRINSCTTVICPLHKFRPLRKLKKEEG